MSAHPSAVANRRGILAITLAMASFIANDALVKHVSESLPTAQLIFIRGVFSSLLLLGVAHAMGLLRAPAGATGRVWHLLADKPVLWRSVLDAVGTMAYLASLFHLPIANATAINMATPLFITLYAALAWRQRVRPGRWVAIGAGFMGVLLVVQPVAEGFNAWALLCLAATIIHTGRDLLTRAIHPGVPSVLITVASALAVTLLSGLACATQDWQAMTGAQTGLLAIASVFLSAAYYLVIVGMREGDVSLVAPFRYTALLFALAIGWIVWGDVPNLLAWAGIVLLVGAGVTMLRGGRR